MAQLSNQLMALTVLAYLAAMVCYAGEYAFGSRSRIGRATARLFAMDGAVVVAVDRDEPGNTALVDELRATGAKAEAVTLDLGDHAAVARAGAEIARRHNSIDVLVNNAGVVAFEPLERFSDAHWQAMVDVNLRAVFDLTHALLGPLRRSSAGAAIVNNASVDGVRGHPEAIVYSTAKAGMIAMARASAYELGKDGIRINAVASGGIMTAMAEGERFSPALLAELERLTPLRRRGTPEEVAKAILFLASDDASFITGEVLTVDGGRTALTAGTLIRA